MSQAIWYLVVGGKTQGPYTDNELADHHILPNSFVKTAEMDDYKEAHELPELRQLFGFKKHTTSPQYFATLDIRLLATVIDYFLIASVYAILMLIAFLFISSQIVQIGLSISGLILIPVAKLIYSGFMEGSARQGTLGKYWLGLKVCNEQGLPLSTQQAFVRNFSKLVSKLTLAIGYISGFFNKKQQCLHDIIAGTLVIKDRLI